MVGAANVLREVVEGLDANQLCKFCGKRKFSTPAAPRQNGCAEALIKSCEKSPKIAIGEQLLMPFVFNKDGKMRYEASGQFILDQMTSS